ncbi:MAG: type II secretion system F family protein [Patescibacteria group bacterium]|nr:type II secretion system F family protein [Patescibacteria group bacterium]
MLFQYEALDPAGKSISGSINAASQDIAITSLQRRGLTVTSLQGGQSSGGLLHKQIKIFGWVSNRDIVLLSREIATLFEAQVSALRVFQLLAEQADKAILREALTTIADDLQSGDSLSKALAKHPKIFSEFYVNMVRAGEESGKLDQTFLFLADYMDRSFELESKARNALIYPAFVLFTFLVVMVLMLTFVIPKISSVIGESGADIPIYTQIVISASNFLVSYGIFILIFLIIGGFFFYRWSRTQTGRLAVDRFRISTPFIGDLYRKLYVSRIADNMHAMLSSGITAVRALEITSSVVNNRLYEGILEEAVAAVKGGSPMSTALSHHPKEIPTILVQMIQIGEETGELGTILERLARFYQREVNTAVDTLVNLIEPALIVVLAVGVGFLLASILIPIYNVANTI